MFHALAENSLKTRLRTGAPGFRAILLPTWERGTASKGLTARVVARAFEIAGGIRLLTDAGYDARLQRTLQDDPNLIALAICPVKGEVHRAFQPDLIKRDEVDHRVSDVLARMSGRGVIIGRPQIIRSGQEMALTIAAPVMNGDEIVAAVVSKRMPPAISNARATPLTTSR